MEFSQQAHTVTCMQRASVSACMNLSILSCMDGLFQSRHRAKDQKTLQKKEVSTQHFHTICGNFESYLCWEIKRFCILWDTEMLSIHLSLLYTFWEILSWNRYLIIIFSTHEYCDFPNVSDLNFSEDTYTYPFFFYIALRLYFL